MTGPDLMQEIFECSREYGYRHYFYGSTPETLKLLEEKLGETYGLDIAGLESPPFRALTPEEDEAAVERINASGADFGLDTRLARPSRSVGWRPMKGVCRGL